MQIADLEKVKERVYGYFPNIIMDMAVIRFLDKQPTVDAVEVVRCKKCRHCEIVDETQRYFCRKPLGVCGFVPVNPDDFCSYGELKECLK